MPDAITRTIPPMLLRTGRPAPGDAPRWAAEVKWDGMRLAFAAEHGRWCARSRPGRRCDQFPELAALAEHLADRSVRLDGELVVLGADGRPDFAALRRRLVAGNREAAGDPVTFVAFDLLWLDGEPLYERPYSERRSRLADSQGAVWAERAFGDA